MIEELKKIWLTLSDEDKLVLVLTLFRDLSEGRQADILTLLKIE